MACEPHRNRAGSHGPWPGVLDSRARGRTAGGYASGFRSGYLPAVGVEEDETDEVDAVGACLVPDPIGVGSGVVIPHLVDEVTSGNGDSSGRVRSFD